MFTRVVRFFAFALLVLVFTGCEKKTPSSNAKPVVVATTTMLADLASQIGGDDVVVRGIMKPGGDPHLYQPTPGDARLIAEADLVITSGLKLEGWIDDLVRNARKDGAIVVVASEGIEPVRDARSPGGVDPHFWFDLTRWSKASKNVEAAISNVAPSSRQGISMRAAEYRRRIAAVDQWVIESLQTIPDKHRVLITSHDAFRYFGDRYGIQVVGIQGISTDEEASQRDLANVVDIIRKRGAPAVFVESSVNPALIKQVARETGVQVAGPLYSDSLGPAGGPADTFLKTVSENVRIVTEALGGKFEPSDEVARR